MLRATQRDESRRMKQMVAAVRLGAWGGADDLARLDAPSQEDDTDAALEAFGFKREP